MFGATADAILGRIPCVGEVSEKLGWTGSRDPADFERIGAMARDADMRAASRDFMLHSIAHRYSYNFTWLGRPIIQYPEDIVAIQEVIWRTRPDCIIETGIAHGGSLVLSASMLQLLGEGVVIGIDVDIRKHNREALEGHPLAHRMKLIEGSSTDPAVVDNVRAMAARSGRCMVILDSNHSEAHVLGELQAYAPIVTEGCYLLVLDTIIENQPEIKYDGRPWSIGNNPMTAMNKFLAENPDFEIDPEYEQKLLTTVAPRGYLRRAKKI